MQELERVLVDFIQAGSDAPVDVVAMQVRGARHQICSCWWQFMLAPASYLGVRHLNTYRCILILGAFWCRVRCWH